MSRRNTIKCSKLGCSESHTEQKYNEGHQGWGNVYGFVDTNGEEPHLCPKHLSEIKGWLNNGKLD